MQRLPRHEYAENAVRCRVNVQPGGICVRLGLERNKVVRVILHFRQPVHDKFVVLARCQADLGQFFAEKIRRVRSGDAKACGEIVVGVVLALPEQVGVFVAVLIVQRAVRLGGDSPAVLVGRIGRGERAHVIQRHGNRRFLLRIEVDDGFFS